MNSGIIASRIGSAIASDYTFTLHNPGILSGATTAVSGSDLVNAIDNSGTINGNISGNGGNDVFDGRGGVVNGTVSGGDSCYTYGRVTIVEMWAETGIENLTLLEGAVINGTGNTLNSTLLSNSDNNVMAGLAGNDTLIGGGSQDFLIGGAGADSFAFTAVNQSANTLATGDRIGDFDQGTDRIDLSATDANAIGATANDAFTFIGTAAVSSVAGQLRYVYDAVSKATYAHGDSVSDAMIRLNGAYALNGGDFIL